MSEQVHCRGPIDRRTWLTIGGLSFGAMASGGLPGLSRLLAAEAAATGKRDDFSVILFWANGGPSHIDLFDLKPAAIQRVENAEFGSFLRGVEGRREGYFRKPQTHAESGQNSLHPSRKERGSPILFFVEEK